MIDRNRANKKRDWKNRGGGKGGARKKGGGNSGKGYASKVVMLSNGILEEDKVREMDDDRIEIGERGWVPFLGKDDSYLDGVLALLENSGTLSAIIEQKVTLVMSGGLIASRGVGGVLGFVNKVKEFVGWKDKGVEDLDGFLNDVNDEEEDIIDVGSRGVDDYFSLGNGFYEMVRGKGKKDDDEKWFSVNHWDASKCKIKQEKKNEDGEITEVRKVGISDNWDKDPNGDDATIVSIYPNWTKMKDGTERSVLHVKKYMRGFKYWGVPEWLPVKKWVELEYRVAMHNVSKFINGYMPSCIIQFFGTKNKTEAQQVVKDIKTKFTDTGNNGKMFVQVLSDEKYKANVQILEDKNDGSFMDLTRLTVQRIVTGLRWAMGIAGVESSGKIGSNQQLSKEYERINNMVIAPVRELFLKKFIMPVVSEAGEWLGKENEWSEIKLNFGNNSIFSLIEKIKVDDVLSINERREVLGMTAFSEEDLNNFIEERKKLKGAGLNKK